MNVPGKPFSTPARIALTLALLAAVAHADEVVTTGGSSYAGKIVAEDVGSVTIETAALGRLRIAKTEISSVRRDDAAGPATTKKETPTEPPKPESGTASTTDGMKPAPAAADHAAVPGPPVPPKSDDKSAAGTGKAEPRKGDAEKTAAPAAKPVESEDPSTLSADERDTRRKAAKIVRRTSPATSKTIEAPTAVDSADEKASLGGSQLAKVEPGSWVIVFQPPTQFEAAPAAIQIGRRIFARLDSAGAASAWLSVPHTDGPHRTLVRLSDVQRHVVLKQASSRIRLIEGVDRSSWIRLRLDDGSMVEGVLRSAQAGLVSIGKLKNDGTEEKVDIVDDKIVEVEGVLRSTAVRLSLADVAVGEPIGLTLWPDGREIIGTMTERTERVVTVKTPEGELVSAPLEGPIADVRRVPAKWRAATALMDTLSLVHVRSTEDLADSRVERDVIGAVVALTAYAVTLETPDGVVVVPFDVVTYIGPVESESEAAAARPMKKSERMCRLPVLPGDPAEKAKDLDPATGVSAVTDGRVVKHVVVTAPFEGEVFGIQLGNRATDARDRTDLRFDTVVTPRSRGGAEAQPAEMISTSLVGVRVTVVLDGVGAVSAIELGAR